MSILREQLRKRAANDRRAVETGERLLGSAVGKYRIETDSADTFLPEDQRQVAMVARYFHLDIPEEIGPCRELPEMIDRMLGPSGASKRRTRLTEKWWKNGDGPLLIRLKDSGRILALFPGFLKGFYYVHPDTGKKIRITEKNSEMFGETAYTIYRPIPESVRTGKDLLLYLIRQVRPGDALMYLLTTVMVTLLLMLFPFVNKIAFSRIIPTMDSSLLVSLAVMMYVVGIGDWLVRSVRFAINLRIQNRLDTVIENSVYSRILSLPVTFFAGQTAGGLSQRIAALNTLPRCLADMLFVVTNFVICLFMGFPILLISPALAAPAVVMMLAILLLLLLAATQEKKLIRAQLRTAEEHSGAVFDTVSGIQRIRLSGSEKRVYGKWLKAYAPKARASYALVFPLFARPQLMNTVRLIGLLWAFAIAYSNHLSVAQLAAFTASYGIIFNTLTPLASRFRNLSQVGPVLKASEPILQAEPEDGENKKDIETLNGNIELSHVTFRYEQDDPAVLDDLSLKIHSGEYVAIVGRSGCGKSTLVRVLLGFETPESGTVSYDGVDMSRINLRSLRRRIGTVLQDGKLFAGDLYSNIVISAPWLSMEDAWEAAEKADIAEDIRQMPMGMRTQLSEGSGGISGGQKQRLMIARAIAHRPAILILDEATSALDNLTQKAVTDSLNGMHCTRIVIAHRLSTIRECDRIIALDHGKVIESGTYDELIAKNGFFADLVARQQIDVV